MTEAACRVLLPLLCPPHTAGDDLLTSDSAPRWTWVAPDLLPPTAFLCPPPPDPPASSLATVSEEQCLYQIYIDELYGGLQRPSEDEKKK